MMVLSALMALLVAAPAAPEPSTRMSAFDVSRAESWADALALCDLTAFLRTRPALEADVVLAPDGRSEFVRPLYGPRFLPPGLFFDHYTRLTFERLEKAGEVDRKSVGAARARHDRPLFRSYQRAGGQDMAFLEEQSKLCGALGLDVRQRYP